MTAKCKVGLVLEGGGMRGAFTAGVLDYFLDKNLSFHTCIGVSAGACHACSFLSKQRRRGFETNTDYLEDETYCSFKNLMKTGDLFGVDMCYRKIPEELNPYDYQAFSENPTEFYVVVTNCKTGEAEYKKITDMHRGIHYVRASSSLPLLSRTVWIKNTPYLDGGIADSIPVKQSEKLGNHKQVVVLTRQRGYRKEPNKAMPAAYLRYQREFPKLVARMKNTIWTTMQPLIICMRKKRREMFFLFVRKNLWKSAELKKIGKNWSVCTKKATLQQKKWAAHCLTL